MSSETAKLSDTTVRCSHCQQPVPRGFIEPGAATQFCCAGCRAVYETIHACGLDGYYKLLESADATRKPAIATEKGYSTFDAPAFRKVYVQQTADGLCSTDLVLEGVTCAACVWLVERLSRVLPGVVEARLSLREGIVRVTWDETKVSLSRIARTLDRFGYPAHPAKGQSRKELHLKDQRRRLIHLALAGAIMGNTMLLGLALYAGMFGGMEGEYTIFFRWISLLLGTISLAWPGAVFFKSAYAAIRTRTTNLDVPIALALLVGGVAGVINVILNRGEIYFDSLTVLVFLLLVGRFIQYRQQRKADSAVELLFSLTPSTCRIVEGDEVVEAPIEALQVGQLVEVRAGDLIPADGVLEVGFSTVNQALLTGESQPVEIKVGDEVFGSSQNVSSPIRIRVSRIGDDTRVGQLMHLIERGIAEKAPIVQFADTVGYWFLVAVTLIAMGIFAFWSSRNLSAAIDHTVAFLIVTCPCVLGLATPLTIAVAIGRMARQNILIKSGAALERLARGGRLVLDKTGTITEGRLQLLRWEGDARWKGVVAEIERKSSHPIARALCEALGSVEADASIRLAVSDIVEKGDGGISANVDGSIIRIGSPRHMRIHEVVVDEDLTRLARQIEREGATAVLIAEDGHAVALVGLGDHVREDSSDAIGELSKMGWKSSILSGDAPDVVAAVAKCVGLDPMLSRGGASPEEKLERMHIGTGKRATVMVGDGVNDAAALAAADVGIAVHGGAEASLAAADVYIASPGLMPLVDLMTIARRTMRTIHRNLAISLSYNLLAGTLAAMGIMNPMIAAIIMPISSASVLSIAMWSIRQKS
jgi:Cu2+-exporting ATPase